MNVQLIGDTLQEEALIKIRTFEKENRTVAQQQEIEQLKDGFYSLFLYLVTTKYGINSIQLYKLSDAEIKSLGEATYHKVKKKALSSIIFVWIFGLAIPFLGWACLQGTYKGNDMSLSKSYSYRRKYRQLRKIFGDKFFSAKCLREKIIIQEGYAKVHREGLCDDQS